MATLKTPVKFMDALMDKMTKKIYIVLHEEMHHVWVIPDGGGVAPFELHKSKINLAYMVVDPVVARVLYDKTNNDAIGADSEQPV